MKESRKRYKEDEEEKRQVTSGIRTHDLQIMRSVLDCCDTTAAHEQMIVENFTTNFTTSVPPGIRNDVQPPQTRP